MLIIKRTIKVLLLIWCGSFFLVATGYAGSDSLTTDNNSEMSVDTVLITGKFKSVDLDAKLMIVKPRKGKVMRFIYNEQTDFTGFVSPVEIERGRRVRIWYFKHGDKNIAAKILLMLELGC